MDEYEAKVSGLGQKRLKALLGSELLVLFVLFCFVGFVLVLLVLLVL